MIILIIVTLGSDFNYFGDLPKIHLDPLSFVIPLGYIGGGMVDPSFAWSSSSVQLPKIIKYTSFHKSIFIAPKFVFLGSKKYILFNEVRLMGSNTIFSSIHTHD